MPDGWTRERVVQLAPDAASVKAGEGLASPRKWVSTGRDDRAVWGECQGSGAKPYQVQVDLADVGFKCSCPSRKFPCKHGVGLMLMHAGGGVAPAAMPEWVKQWLDSRSQRQAKKTEPRDMSPQKVAERAEAQEERRSKRLDRVKSGMSDLRLWLEDLLRGGLAAAPAKGFSFFEDRARRLVDAQAPGAARLVRDIASASASGEGWQRRTLEAAGTAYLLTEATDRLEKLNADLREDVLATLGVSPAKESLDAQPAVSDVWQIFGRQVEVEVNLKTQWTYLYGLKTRRSAVLLDFAYGNAGLDASVPVGSLFPADLVFYPGQSLRAAVRATTHDVAPIKQLVGPNSIAKVLDLHATLLAARPWLGGIGSPLCQVVPILDGDRWFLVDRNDEAIEIRPRGLSTWTATAMSAGQPVSVGITLDGRSAQLLSVVADGKFVDVVPPAEVGA